MYFNKSIYKLKRNVIKYIWKLIDRYKKQDTWPKTTEYKKESFDHLQEIMKNANELDKKVSYDKLKYDIK